MTLDEILAKLPIESVEYIERRTKVLIEEEYNRIKILNTSKDAHKPCKFTEQEKSNLNRCACGATHDYKTGETDKCKLGYR